MAFVVVVAVVEKQFTMEDLGCLNTSAAAGGGGGQGRRPMSQERSSQSHVRSSVVPRTSLVFYILF